MIKLEIDKRAYNSITKNFSKLVYTKAIKNLEDLPKKEEIVTLTYNGKFVAKALYNPKSVILKILTTENEDIDYNFFYKRILKAKIYREEILNYKDTYRWIYAEGDNLPTIIFDKYNNIGAMQLMSKLIEKEYLKDIIDILFELSDLETVYVKRGKKGEKIKDKIFGEKKKYETIIKEGKAKFKVNLKGHKTGFFLDQRENRLAIEKFVKEGDRVLDICCYTGGFSVHCAIKGAEVVGVDLSKKALKVAEENMELNNIPKDKYTFIEGNAFKVMEEFIENGEKFDIVILDPPAFTQTEKDIKNALRAYSTLNYLGINLCKRIFVTCSCSHHIDRELFKRTVISSAFRAKKELIMIDYKGQSPDHPISIGNKNLEYLKCIFFYVKP
ncbi:class I SAM-dependent rRNA methyltransferase [Methanocaldococcus sp.]|uniref:class I SAM-dependent rRNA methyltransferase n=1 Tax=Methanocaldococcus sp. TaxID=2152917 RepID=UPI00261CBBB3|nr:class I SAM-dependent rRNA methyltransferase [Methanocaldococcus sp.]MCQ6254214.1 class I SAM-dependent rRNA methyltransferase [Methanocaldococcus sp.]